MEQNYESVTGFQHLEHTGPQNQVSHLKIVPTTPEISICDNQNIWHVKDSERSPSILVLAHNNMLQITTTMMSRTSHFSPNRYEHKKNLNYAL